jgi:hypothetical protein
MKNSIRLLLIQDQIDQLTKEYRTASTERRLEIESQYHKLNQEHCNIRANAHKTAKIK